QIRRSGARRPQGKGRRGDGDDQKNPFELHTELLSSSTGAPGELVSTRREAGGGKNLRRAQARAGAGARPPSSHRSRMRSASSARGIESWSSSASRQAARTSPQA